MWTWILAVSLLAAAGAASTNANAADLDEGPPPDRYGSVYDDPRYADVYRKPTPPPYAAPLPRERVYRDDRERVYRDDEVIPPYARPHRYSYDDVRPGFGGQCVPREVVRDRLTRHGWHDFHDGALNGNVAVVRARRPNGRLFELTIERCSGEIVSAYPLERRAFGPFAYGPRPWWQRHY
jgi:hypothetical protein